MGDASQQLFQWIKIVHWQTSHVVEACEHDNVTTATQFFTHFHQETSLVMSAATNDSTQRSSCAMAIGFFCFLECFLDRCFQQFLADELGLHPLASKSPHMSHSDFFLRSFFERKSFTPSFTVSVTFKLVTPPAISLTGSVAAKCKQDFSKLLHGPIRNVRHNLFS